MRGPLTCPYFYAIINQGMNPEIWILSLKTLRVYYHFGAHFVTSFTRQMNTARALFGRQLSIPRLDQAYIMELLRSLLEFYAQRDVGLYQTAFASVY